ncbi:MAG: protein kinase [Verrucomicrobia bacterium]|nr:protein kinase [Verrucomicrobiota bacterium]
MKTKRRRTCPSCGNHFSGVLEFCPVCMVRKAIDLGAESGRASPEKTVKPVPEVTVQRFGHYELVRSKEGTPVELGRGGMGVTYKAFDADLRYPVTLKVISERFLSDESVRLRFLREARAAASIRHPNVASVFHLGRTGEHYFYAMEFVEGETLESLIKRSGHLQFKPALEIATQVAAGLAAVHKQKLVHRDIKPSNIMVRFEDDGAVTAKIIDLGLAKSLTESGSTSAISISGGFAGTPEFASPEQFVGVGVDIRSDLYSLGAMLWKAVTGDVVFTGSPSELMYQHQHASLPLKKLGEVPQPVAVLLETLLEKDPARRFQNPVELLDAMSKITAAIEAGRTITRQSLQKTPALQSSAVTRRPKARLGPKKVSLARLPITGGGFFGREEDIAFLDAAWANERVNIVTIVAWAGVGKSTLLNHWLHRMASEHYRSAQLVFGWSFYRQGASGATSSADEFLDAALAWFGDPDPRIGTPWEKGERLAKLVARRRTLLVLDGLEPLQNPPGPQEGRLREPSLQALLRELAAFNSGLCIITTRQPVADIADHENTSAPRRDLEQLSNDAGAKLLRALGVTGDEVELRSTSDEFSGHCLALTLLGSYLTDAFNGDIRCRSEVSGRLADDLRQGVHARKVMDSYQTWLGEGPELAVLRMLGLFDRPVDEKALANLLKSPAIPGLTEPLIDLSPTEWRTILGKLRRARLLAAEDPHNPGCIDAHPLVREYFGGQLRSQRTDAWKESHRRLYNYYRTLAPKLPGSFREMEPLFLAAICGCNAGLFRDVLREVYIARIQRGNAFFAANVLGARGALLSVLVHFFEHGCWGSPVETDVEKQRLTAEDQLLVLMQAALYLSLNRGMQAPEVRTCYERAEPLCHSLRRPLLLYVALIGRWRYSLATDKLPVTLRIAKRVYSLAREQNDSALLIKAYMALAATLYFSGDFQSARQNALQGVQMWCSGGVQYSVEEVDAPAIGCLCTKALIEWLFDEIPFCQTTMAEAIALAKKLNDMHGLAVALNFASILGYLGRNPTEVECLATDLIELSTRQNFAFWLAQGAVYRGWARSVSGEMSEGISWLQDGLEDYRATGGMLGLPIFLALKSEALYLAGRTAEALESITEAEGLAERIQLGWCSAELYRLRGVFLAALGAAGSQIETAFREAIRIARKQKAISLKKRAEATYAEYRSQTASRMHDLRLPL